MRGAIPIVITVVGNKVIKVMENPFDGQMPYHSVTGNGTLSRSGEMESTMQSVTCRR